MKLRINLKLVLLLFSSVFSQACNAQEPSKLYLINTIDSTTLSYYYLINISPADSLNVSCNVLSIKISDTLYAAKNIEIGEYYKFELVPMYDMIEKRGNLDSVYFSPATMKTIVINGILLFTESYEVTPFSTSNLIGLKYLKP